MTVGPGAGACVAVGGVHGRRHGHCSGRYPSYWNAFLLIYCFDRCIWGLESYLTFPKI